MENLQIFKAHLPQNYEDHVTKDLVQGECHKDKRNNHYFVQINLFKMELEGATEDAVVIVAQSTKRVFGAVYQKRKEIFKAEPNGNQTMPNMINVLKGPVVTQEKEDYSCDDLTGDQRTLLSYLEQKTPAKHQDPIDSKKTEENEKKDTNPPLTPKSNGKKYRAALFLMSVVALGFFAHKVHKGGIKLPSNLPSKQDLLDSWTQFKDGFQSRLGSVKA